MFVGALLAFEISFIFNKDLQVSKTAMMYVRESAFTNREVGYSSALSVVLCMMIIVIVIVSRKVFDENSEK